MEIDPREMPPTTAGEETLEIVTPKNQAPEPVVIDHSAELETLKTKNLELQKQKEHWREKYERDIKPDTSANIPDDSLSDEAKMLKGELNSLKGRLSTYEKEKDENKVYSLYPALRDKQAEFNEFLADPDNAGIRIEKVAKLFLVEKGLADDLVPKRLGLERPTAGTKIQPQSGMPVEDAKRLRETNYRLYEKKLMRGEINPDHIK